MPVTFRQAATNDVKSILAMIEIFYQQDQYPFDETITEDVVTRLIHDETLGRVWLIELDATIIGYTVLTFGYSLEYHGRDAFIDEIFLSPEHRGKKIGTATLAFLEEQCQALGIQALHLEVEQSNAPAQALYRKQAFDDHGRILLTKHIAHT